MLPQKWAFGHICHWETWRDQPLTRPPRKQYIKQSNQNWLNLSTSLKSHSNCQQSLHVKKLLKLCTIILIKPNFDFNITHEKWQQTSIMGMIIDDVHSILIWNPKMLKTQGTKKKRWGNCIAWFAHHNNGFLVFVNCTNNCWNNCKSFSRWTWLHHHLIQLDQKTSHHLQLSLTLLLP
jgi:hypothetical protein